MKKSLWAICFLVPIILTVCVAGSCIIFLCFNPGVACVLSINTWFCDQYELNSLFNSNHPGYSQLEVLESKGQPFLPTGRTLTLRVVLEAFPEKVTCIATLYYFNGDPGMDNLTWESKFCDDNARIIGLARLMITECSHCAYPDLNLPAAQLLKSWIQQGRINLMDIKLRSARETVNRMLEEDGTKTK